MVEKLESCMFLQTGSSVFVPYSSGGGKPSSHQARMGGKGVGGGAEKSHESYLRAGGKKKNACERQEKLILFPSSD